MSRERRSSQGGGCERAQPELLERRLMFPYGFIDPDGVHRFWPAGAVIADPDELGLLLGRGATFVEA